MRDNLWTEQQDSRLKDLCARTDRSSSRMAEIISVEFGRKISRNAVRGRARRLGLILPVEPDREAEPAPAYQPHLSGPRAIEYQLPRFTKRMEILKDPGGPGVLLLNRTSLECARPLDDSVGMQMRVCGEPVIAEGKSYCAECHKRMYRKAPAPSEPLYAAALRKLIAAGVH